MMKWMSCLLMVVLVAGCGKQEKADVTTEEQWDEAFCYELKSGGEVVSKGRSAACDEVARHFYVNAAKVVMNQRADQSFELRLYYEKNKEGQMKTVADSGWIKGDGSEIGGAGDRGKAWKYFTFEQAMADQVREFAAVHSELCGEVRKRKVVLAGYAENIGEVELGGSRITLAEFINSQGGILVRKSDKKAYESGEVMKGVSVVLERDGVKHDMKVGGGEDVSAYLPLMDGDQINLSRLLISESESYEHLLLLETLNKDS